MNRKRLKKIKNTCMVWLMCASLLIPGIAIYAADGLNSAKDDWLESYTEIYGVEFDVTMGQAGFYIAALYVDVDTEAGLTDAVKVYADSNMIGFTSGFPTSNKEALDIAAGESDKFVYMSETPLFTENAALARARVVGINPGDDFEITGLTWLDKEGNPMSEAPEDPDPEDPDPEEPGDGDFGSSYTAEAKQYTNYTEIYGIEFRVTMGDSGFYLAGIFVDADVESGLADAVQVVCSESMKAYTAVFETDNIVAADVAPGEQVTFRYQSDTALFPADSALVQARLEGINPGDDFTINGITWIDQEGNALDLESGTTPDPDPNPDPNPNPGPDPDPNPNPGPDPDPEPQEENGPDYTADAKGTDFYSQIYGVKFVVEMGESGFYMAAIYVDDNEVSGLTDAVKVYADSNMIGYTSSFPTENKVALDIAAGETATLEYLSDSPLFSAGADIAQARIAGIDPANDYNVVKAVWLDKDGNELGEASAGENPEFPEPPANPEPPKDTGKKDDTKKNGGGSTAPKTGNESDMTMVIAFMLLSAVGMAVMMRKYFAKAPSA